MIAHPVLKALVVILLAGACYVIALTVKRNAINNRKALLQSPPDLLPKTSSNGTRTKLDWISSYKNVILHTTQNYTSNKKLHDFGLHFLQFVSKIVENYGLQNYFIFIWLEKNLNFPALILAVKLEFKTKQIPLLQFVLYKIGKEKHFGESDGWSRNGSITPGQLRCATDPQASKKVDSTECTGAYMESQMQRYLCLQPYHWHQIF